MSTQESEQLKSQLRGNIENVVNKHDFAEAHRYWSPDLIIHHPTQAEPIRGLDGYRALLETAWKGFSDWHVTTEEVLAEGDFLGARFTSRGTHDGKFAGFPPTGQKFAVTELMWFRFRDGVVEEAWVIPDLMQQMQQMGLMPEGPPPKPMIMMMGLMRRLSRKK